MNGVSFINKIATALPPNEAHEVFIAWAERQLADPRERLLFRRMAGRSGIERRWSVLSRADQGGVPGEGCFYAGGGVPSTAERMAVYAATAPGLCMAAIEKLGPLDGVTHIVLASCTGFIAPGIDQIIARRLGLASSVERTLIGFMGCYAAISALRAAHHIVRSRPDARVLVVTVELCTLHLQPVTALDRILAMLLFGDGAAAALVSSDAEGLAFGDPFATALADSDDLITWTIGDTGFAMHLSGAVPARIGASLSDPDLRRAIGDVAAVDQWAVHAGGRSVLDAVEAGLGLDPAALVDSREVLREAGNMSSATLMFVLERILTSRRPVENGLAIAFGPGLAAEGLRFRSIM